MIAIIQVLRSIVGVDGVETWDELNQRWQAILGRSLVSLPTPPVMVYPRTQSQLAAIMTCAHRHGWRVLPCGLGSKLHWGGVVSGVEIVVSTARLTQLVEHAVGDLTFTAEAGMPFAIAQSQLNQSRQHLAIDPNFAHTATLGGILATADTGSLRHRFGGVRDRVLGLSIVRCDGEMVKCGGRVVKNVAGYDLMKLFTGSFGTLGVISQVTLRVYPQAEAFGAWIGVGESTAIAQTATALLASTLTPTTIDLLSPQCVNDLKLGHGMGLVVTFESLTDSVQWQGDRLTTMGESVGLCTQIIGDRTLYDSLWHGLKRQMDGDGVEALSNVIDPSSSSKCIREPINSDHVSILCKLGIRSTEAVTLFTQLDTILAIPWFGQIHMGSGLGRLRFNYPGSLTPATIDQLVNKLLAVRTYCHQFKGFLTILDAPIRLKQKMDVWGYMGNALTIQQSLKQQFDPLQLLSPQRFLGDL